MQRERGSEVSVVIIAHNYPGRLVFSHAQTSLQLDQRLKKTIRPPSPPPLHLGRASPKLNRAFLLPRDIFQA